MEKNLTSNYKWWSCQRHVLVNLRKTIDQILKSHLNLMPGQKVVDIGCGDKPYELIFKEYGCRYLGCDLDGVANIRIKEGEKISIPDKSADGIVSFQVLEHVWDLNWYLGECKRILKNDGWLLLSTHGSWLYHPHPTDYRRWTRDGLVKELEERSFKVKNVFAVVGPLALTTQYRLLGIYLFLKKIPLFGPILLFPITIFMNLLMSFEDLITPTSFKETNACVYVTVSYKTNTLKSI